MPTENRFIVFNYEEVYKALRIRKITENEELPPNGKITKLDFHDQGGPQDNIEIVINSEDGKPQNLEFTREFFALALVFFCQGSNIPIPRAGTKSLVHKDQTIVMHIQIG